MHRDVVTVPGTSVRLLGGDRICSGIARRGDFEPASLAAWCHLAQPGEIMVDVGSYSGLYAILAALCGAVAVAIEPLPDQQQRILDNAKLNGVRVELFKCAASDQDGATLIHYNPRAKLTSGASIEPGVAANTATCPVIIKRLDDLDFGGPVHAIKIDVERHEQAVLRGAQRIIACDRPCLLIEVLDPMQQEAVASLLPDYIAASRLDGRNILFQPMGSPVGKTAQKPGSG